MSAQEYWEGEPKLAVSYREAEKLRRENRYIGEWRAGVYVARAVGAVLSKDAKYPEKPLFSIEAEERASEEERERAHMEDMMRRFMDIAAAVNRHRAEQGEEAPNDLAAG